MEVCQHVVKHLNQQKAFNPWLVTLQRAGVLKPPIERRTLKWALCKCGLG